MRRRMLDMFELIRGRRYRFTILLGFLFLLVAIHPIVFELPRRASILGTIGLDTLTAAVLLASVHIAGRLKRLRLVLVLLAVPVLGLTAATYIQTHQTDQHITHNSIIVISMHILVIIFFTIMMFTILKHVLEGGWITLDEINGAVCVYLLIGLSGAYVYSLLQYINPASFNLSEIEPGGEMMRHRRNFPSLLYYSLVTLTTLGYGDITPQTPLARTAASLQAIFGQVYLAVLIARLVGTQIAHAQKPKAK